MASFKLSIWYAGSDVTKPQVHLLTAVQVMDNLRPELGFVYDMLYNEGRGVRKLTLEVVDA